MATATTPAQPTRRIQTVAEGKAFIARFGEAMEALLSLVEEETDLVRAGRLREAAALEARKAELAGKYHAAVERFRADAAFLTQHLPGPVDMLRRRHAEFRPLLQLNLTVLATVHAVSEGLIRGAAEELARKSAPQTYGASGRTAAATGTARPVAVSRSL